MEKQELVKQLRLMCMNAGATKVEVDSATDRDIINTVTQCPCCGDKFCTDTQLKGAISKAKDANDFINIVDAYEIINAPSSQN